jgi:hypothetical protein
MTEGSMTGELSMPAAFRKSAHEHNFAAYVLGSSVPGGTCPPLASSIAVERDTSTDHLVRVSVPGARSADVDLDGSGVTLLVGPDAE